MRGSRRAHLAKPLRQAVVVDAKGAVEQLVLEVRLRALHGQQGFLRWCRYF